MRYVLPFTAIVGQERLKKALILNAINPNLRGVLIMGERGTAKSTAVRALAQLLPEIEVVADCPFNCHPTDRSLQCESCARRAESGEKLPVIRRKMKVVDLPLGATEDRIVGTLDIERALREGIKALQPGLLAEANRGILYIDEIKNLSPEEAVTLLTVLEDGQLPITMRSKWHDVGTAAMAVATEPVPCMCFLVGAGNFDSISQIHPALMDRFYGYGKVVRMNEDMPNTVENRRKYVQFIAQEVKRFHLIPFSREAVSYTHLTLPTKA